MPVTLNGSTQYLDNGGNVDSEGEGDSPLGIDTKNFYPGAMSASIWVKPTDTATTRIFFQHGRKGSTSFIATLAILADESVRQYCGGQSSDKYQTSSELVDVDAWNHIGAVWNGTAGVLYVNGVKISFTSTSSYSDAAADEWRMLLGASRTTGAASSWLAGKLAHAAIWNAALSDANFEALLTSLPSAVEAGSLRSYWPLVADGNDTILTGDPAAPRLNLVSQPESWIGGAQPSFSADDGPPISASAVPPRRNPVVVSMPGDLTLQRQALLLV
jgi:hypothetical protein